jgi:hypothetical protein
MNQRCRAQGVPPCPWHLVQLPNVPQTLPAPLHVEHRPYRQSLQRSSYPML